MAPARLPRPLRSTPVSDGCVSAPAFTSRGGHSGDCQALLSGAFVSMPACAAPPVHGLVVSQQRQRVRRCACLRGDDGALWFLGADGAMKFSHRFTPITPALRVAWPALPTAGTRSRACRGRERVSRLCVRAPFLCGWLPGCHGGCARRDRHRWLASATGSSSRVAWSTLEDTKVAHLAAEPSGTALALCEDGALWFRAPTER
jgi:hypothetical protein